VITDWPPLVRPDLNPVRINSGLGKFLFEKPRLVSIARRATIETHASAGQALREHASLAILTHQPLYSSIGIFFAKPFKSENLNSNKAAKNIDKTPQQNSQMYRSHIQILK
jgi:hypothetical protein